MNTTIKHLQNGTIICLENLPHLKSISIAFWVKIGSRYEPPELSGITHFVEHLLFKGTEKRNTAIKIAREIESVGGHINAFTNREYTCVYCKILPQYLDIAVDLLIDIFYSSLFDVCEIEKEKIVILDEVKIEEDEPDDFILDLFMRNTFGENDLGQSVIGKCDTIKNFSRDIIYNHYKKNYTENNLIISVAGKINDESVLDTISASLQTDFSQVKGDAIIKCSKTLSGSPSLQEVKNKIHTTDNFRNSISLHSKDIGLTYFILGMPGLHCRNEDRYTLSILDEIFGGGCTSRLFQKVREEKGLVYDIHSYHSSYQDTGVFGISGSCQSENLMEVLSIVIQEINKIKQGEVFENEILETKRKLTAGVEMSSESTEARMVKLAKNIMNFKRDFTDEEIISKIESVTKDDIVRLANKLWNDKHSMTILGPIDGNDKDMITDNINNLLSKIE